MSHKFSTHGELNFFGYMVHTTGDGIPKTFLAQKDETDLLAFAVQAYVNMDKRDKCGPHYVIAPNGQVAKLREETVVAWHCGVSATEREAFLTTNWETNGRTDVEVVKWWKRRWPAFKSPSHLYPDKSANKNYVGIELVPAGSYSKMEWKPTLAGGNRVWGRFTTAQYISLAKITFPLGISYKLNQLVGHEDVNPITRPGWDPGDKLGAFNWDYFLDLRQALWHISNQGESV